MATGWDRLVSPHVDIQANPTVASTMPTAVTRPGSKRRVRKPPASAPTGSATSIRTSTSAASSCEVGYTVIRAKIGMSTSAAISADPTKKLTTSAPQAGAAANAPCGTSGSAARRTCEAEQRGGDE